MPTELAVKIITGVIVAIIVAAIMKFGRKAIEEWQNASPLRAVGLRSFLPYHQFVSRRPFAAMVEEARGDEVLIIGRTLRSLFEAEEASVVKGLQNGLHFKLLVLDPAKIEDGSLNLDPLQLKDVGTIRRDLSTAKKLFVRLCEEAAKANFPGSLEVRTCHYVIFNSFTAFSQEKHRKVILDHSFSEAAADKYQQYFETRHRDDKEHFCNKLYNWHAGLYDRAEFYVKYTQGRIERSARLIAEDVNELALEYSESEKARNNEPAKLLFAVPQIFEVLDKDSPETPLPPPLSVQIELTNRCDAACKHCQRHSWGRSQSEEMSTQRILQLLDDLAEFRVESVTLSGGEPTLRPDFPVILRHAHEQGLHVGVLTTGLSITSELANDIALYADWVRISLDGSSAGVYERVRTVREGFDRVMVSIKNLDQAAQEHEGCKIGICYSIQRRNVGDVSDMIKLVKSLPLSRKDKVLTFKFVHGSNGFLCDANHVIDFQRRFLDNETPDLDKLTNFPYLRRFMGGSNQDCGVFSNRTDIAQGIPLRTYYQTNPTRCYTPYIHSLVDAFGDVYPCCFLYHDNDSYEDFQSQRQKYKLGRIQAPGDFRAIWNGDKYADIRSKLKTINISRFPECRQCLRHYLHNAFLTRLHTQYESYVRDMGSEGQSRFYQVLTHYPPEVVWL